MVVDAKGKLIARAGAFKEELLIADLIPAPGKKHSPRGVVNVCLKFSEKEKPVFSMKKAPMLTAVAEIYQALVLGLHDYVTKNNFGKAVIGLSGGIDSSLVASLAVDALGKENVVGVFMPSEYSSQDSQEDAFALAQNLGIQFFTVPINGIFKAYLWELRDCFSGKQPDITEENLQARVRGNILMALSNKFRWLVITTGNKSEMSTGYATLYGDMAGGFAVIKDVPKILVYRLSEYRNSLSKVIPERAITKAPTAELRPNQKDSDTLPSYETLDVILKAYVEQDKDLSKIISLGFSEHDVRRVLEMVDRSEYKRRQSPPGIKITHKAFGKDRRMPITNRYKG